MIAFPQLSPYWKTLLKRYGFAIILAVAALLMRLAVPTHRVQISPFYLAIALATWYGGWIAGILCTLLSVGGLALLNLPPFGSYIITYVEIAYFFGGIILLMSLVVSRKHAGERARERSLEFEAIFDLAAVGIAKVDLNGKWLRVNERLCEMLGTSREELLDCILQDFTFPGDRNLDLEHFPPNISGVLKPSSYEKRCLKKDGSVLWINSTVSLVSDRSVPKYFIVIIEDISARKRAEDSIKEESRRKDEYLAMLAHELRNPLGPIRNAVTLLKTPACRESSATQAVNIIDRQINHMTRIVDDLLDISRISQGRILLRKQRLNLVEFIREAADDHRSDASTAQLSLDARLPMEPVWVDGDSTRLTQVIDNLIHNAIKFTPAGGRITMEVCAPSKEVAAVTIRDTGLGLEAGMIEQLFQPFVQADRSLDRRLGGLGLGLALVKGIIEAHDGHVTATSPGKGLGSEFVFELPRVPAPPPSQMQSREFSQFGSFKILLIEDNIDAAESLLLLLESYSHVVKIAQSGAEGMTIARSFHPDLIICDIGLPGGMSGYDVAERIHHDPVLHNTYLVALTGYGQGDDKRRALAAGFNVHLTKPVDIGELLNTLSKVPHSCIT